MKCEAAGYQTQLKEQSVQWVYIYVCSSEDHCEISTHHAWWCFDSVDFHESCEVPWLFGSAPVFCRCVHDMHLGLQVGWSVARRQTIGTHVLMYGSSSVIRRAPVLCRCGHDMHPGLQAGWSVACRRSQCWWPQLAHVHTGPWAKSIPKFGIVTVRIF